VGQGCGTGSGYELDPDSIGSVDPDPGGEKMTHKSRKKIMKFHVLSSNGCSLLRAEGFFCNLDVLFIEALG
jgi:hypothetical protein